MGFTTNDGQFGLISQNSQSVDVLRPHSVVFEDDAAVRGDLPIENGVIDKQLGTNNVITVGTDVDTIQDAVDLLKDSVLPTEGGTFIDIPAGTYTGSIKVSGIGGSYHSNTAFANSVGVELRGDTRRAVGLSYHHNTRNTTRLAGLPVGNLSGEIALDSSVANDLTVEVTSAPPVPGDPISQPDFAALEFVPGDTIVILDASRVVHERQIVSVSGNTVTYDGADVGAGALAITFCPNVRIKGFFFDPALELIGCGISCEGIWFDGNAPQDGSILAAIYLVDATLNINRCVCNRGLGGFGLAARSGSKVVASGSGLAGFDFGLEDDNYQATNSFFSLDEETGAGLYLDSGSTAVHGAYFFSNYGVGMQALRGSRAEVRNVNSTHCPFGIQASETGSVFVRGIADLRGNPASAVLGGGIIAADGGMFSMDQANYTISDFNDGIRVTNGSTLAMANDASTGYANSIDNNANGITIEDGGKVVLRDVTLASNTVNFNVSAGSILDVESSADRPNNVVTYTADGALEDPFERHVLEGSAVRAMTMDLSTGLQAGRTYRITNDATADAHTLTLSNGSFKGLGNGTVATWAGLKAEQEFIEFTVVGTEAIVSSSQGVSFVDAGRGTVTYTADGAIEDAYPIHVLEGSALRTMTLDLADASYDGRTFVVTNDSTIAAHTLTLSNGTFGGQVATTNNTCTWQNTNANQEYIEFTVVGAIALVRSSNGVAFT